MKQIKYNKGFRMRKLGKKDTYYGCDSYDFEYFQPNPPKFRLQKLEDGYYTRRKRKGMFYHMADLDDTKYIFNVTKLKRKKNFRKFKKGH